MLEIFKTLPEEIFCRRKSDGDIIKDYKLGDNPSEIIIALLRNPVAISEGELEKILHTIFDGFNSESGKIYCMQKSSLALATGERRLPIDLEEGEQEVISEDRESTDQYRKENYFINYLIRKMNFADPSNYAEINYEKGRYNWSANPKECSPMARVVNAIKFSRDMELIQMFTLKAIQTIDDETTPEAIKTSLLEVLTEDLVTCNRMKELHSYKEYEINPDFIMISRDYICEQLSDFFDRRGDKQKSLEYAFFIQDPAIKMKNSKMLFIRLVNFFKPDLNFKAEDFLPLADAGSEELQMEKILPSVTEWFFKKKYQGLVGIEYSIGELEKKFLKPVAHSTSSVLSLFDSQQRNGAKTKRDGQEYEYKDTPLEGEPDLRRQRVDVEAVRYSPVTRPFLS